MSQAKASDLPPVGLVIAGAGTGERLGAKIPKAFVMLDGETLLVRSTRPFLQLRPLVEIVAVVPDGWEAAAAETFDAAGISSIVRAVVPGAAVRQESVARGLAALGPKPEIVLVHDAARPMASAELVERVARAAAEGGAAIPGIRPIDTIKEVSGDDVSATPDRANLRAIQTPQGFRRELLERAYAAAAVEGTVATDDSALVESLGETVRVVAGERTNMKVTVAEDLAMCEALLAEGAPAPVKGVRR